MPALKCGQNLPAISSDIRRISQPLQHFYSDLLIDHIVLGEQYSQSFLDLLIGQIEDLVRPIPVELWIRLDGGLGLNSEIEA